MVNYCWRFFLSLTELLFPLGRVVVGFPRCPGHQKWTWISQLTSQPNSTISFRSKQKKKSKTLIRLYPYINALHRVVYLPAQDTNLQASHHAILSISLIPGQSLLFSAVLFHYSGKNCISLPASPPSVLRWELGEEPERREKRFSISNNLFL